jgi:hypothetical protein
MTPQIDASVYSRLRAKCNPRHAAADFVSVPSSDWRHDMIASPCLICWSGEVRRKHCEEIFVINRRIPRRNGEAKRGSSIRRFLKSPS